MAGKTIRNVLKGIATLYLREPNDAKAEMSDQQAYAGSYSAKLYKSGSGRAGSTRLELKSETAWLALTPAALVNDPTDYSFYFHYSEVTGNFAQFELYYEDPNSDGWMELTVVPHQNTLGLATWTKKPLASGDKIGYGGKSEAGASFFDWDLGDTIAEAVSGPAGQSAAPDVSDWQLKRVRIELWEASPERTAYADSVEIDGTTYTIEPGGTAPGMELDSASVEVGYSEEGITVEYTAETEDIRVDEETVAIGAALTSEEVTITMNLAESSMYNLDKAMAGSLLSGSILKIGAGTLKILNARIELTNPAGYKRHILIPSCFATGGVAMLSRKNEKTVVPITLKALKTTNEAAVTIIENVA